MIRSAVAEARVLESWQGFQNALVEAIAPLTEEQLTERLVSGLRSVGEIAEHIVFGRALWLHHVLGDGASDVDALRSWDKPGDPPRTAADVVRGLEVTWQVIAATLTSGDASDEVSEEEVVVLRTIWGLIDHDLPHGGELSLLLGAFGLPGVEV